MRCSARAMSSNARSSRPGSALAAGWKLTLGETIATRIRDVAALAAAATSRAALPGGDQPPGRLVSRLRAEPERDAAPESAAQPGHDRVAGLVSQLPDVALAAV